MTDIPFDALVGLTIHRIDTEVTALARIARSQALTDDDRENATRIIKALSEVVGVQQMEAA